MKAPRPLCLLGSTGSVGLNTIDIVRHRASTLKVVGLSCGRQVAELARQIVEFDVRMVSVADQDAANELLKNLGSERSLDFLGIGPEGHAELVKRTAPEVLVAAMSGTHGLRASLQAIAQGVPIVAVANKEILVMAGPFIREALENSPSQLIPVDSEHSAIFQALQGNDSRAIRRIFLTASGGPFRLRKAEDFSRIGVKEALKHPNWKMGNKITIDSATMMNKGLEYIEALQLFPVSREQIEILVHPQSVIHSMVEFSDHSVMAQMGLSDMRIPISYALSFPQRETLSQLEAIDFAALGRLDFEPVDLLKFPCLKLAMEAEKAGLAACVGLNAANEVAVAAFLEERIQFIDIPFWIESALTEFGSRSLETLSQTMDLDLEVKTWIQSKISSDMDDRLKSGQNG
jgi:1-deoxy-D-xylulose-5-phosphate reductoisomerase